MEENGLTPHPPGGLCNVAAIFQVYPSEVWVHAKAVILAFDFLVWTNISTSHLYARGLCSQFTR